MAKFYTYDAWVDTFKPIKNHLRNQDHGLQIAFETYGEEVEFVQKADNKYIWTEVDGDSGTYIIAGYHWVNRFQYYITEKPWDDEFTEVPTWVYRECDCVNEDGDPDNECSDCEGEGTVNIMIDTVDQLKEIYGEEAPIVA